MSHNFSHSFVSLMNYVDDDYVINDLCKMARKSKGNRIQIQWLPSRFIISWKYSLRVRKAIVSYQKYLNTHLENHGVVKGMIDEMRTDIYLRNNHQVWVEAYLRDSRGREYCQYVSY